MVRLDFLLFVSVNITRRACCTAGSRNRSNDVTKSPRKDWEALLKDKTSLAGSSRVRTAFMAAVDPPRCENRSFCIYCNYRQTLIEDRKSKGSATKYRPWYLCTSSPQRDEATCTFANDCIGKGFLRSTSCLLRFLDTARSVGKRSTPEEGEIQEDTTDLSYERDWDASDAAWMWLLLAMYEMIAGSDLPAALKAFDAALLLAKGSLEASSDNRNSCCSLSDLDESSSLSCLCCTRFYCHVAHFIYAFFDCRNRSGWTCS